MKMKWMGLLVAGMFLIYAFRGYSDFEKQVVSNFVTFVKDLPQEKIYVHTDKNAYTVGENVWFRAYGVHALVNTPGIPSHFIYVDLVDKRDSLVDRVKIGMRDSCFYGQMVLSKNLRQGEYCLRAYTYNLQKQGGDYLFKKKIRVINPQDSKVRTDVTYRRDRNGYIATVKFLDGNGAPYVRVPVTYSVGEAEGRLFGQKSVHEPGGSA